MNGSRRRSSSRRARKGLAGRKGPWAQRRTDERAHLHVVKGGRSHRRRRALPLRILLAILVATIALGLVATRIDRVPGLGPVAGRVTGSNFAICQTPMRWNCVVDGDTFWRNGTKIRIADIDTPEVFSPGCEAERVKGLRATERLRDLLSAGPFELKPIGERDEDRYGRKLRVVTRDGRSLGNQLVSEGLARTWTGRRQPWCY